MFATITSPPSTIAPVAEWRKYLLQLSALDGGDVSVRIALKSARDIINMKEELARVYRSIGV